MVNIILCGGHSTRLWPLISKEYPKQFCYFAGKYSLFQQTILRNKNICDKIIVVTNVMYYKLAKSQIEKLGVNDNVVFILESIGRNTAPAIIMACLTLSKNEIVLVTPSDHFIKDKANYRKIAKKTIRYAENDYLVTFGIKPEYPNTNFGYIKADGENVVSFHEKPDEKTAQKYLKSGNFFWNSGIFAFKAETFLEQVMKYSEKVYHASKDAFDNRDTKKNVISIPKSYMKKIPDDSIDYAVMEKSKKLKILPLGNDWYDLGGFEAIYEISKQDKNGNVSPSKNILLNSKNNLIISNNKPVVLVDINDLIIIDTADALLISKKGSSHKIKELIGEIEKK